MVREPDDPLFEYYGIHLQPYTVTDDDEPEQEIPATDPELPNTLMQA